MKFNSQICTTREQSERLIALGLKKETADMYMTPSWGGSKIIGYYAPDVVTFDDHFDENLNDLPAWSLHRLIEILSHTQYPYYVISKELPIYDALCERIEWLIKEGYFNKEYLV